MQPDSRSYGIKQNLRFCVLVFSLHMIVSPVTNSQAGHPDHNQLNLKDTGENIENTILLNTSEANYNVIKEITGRKVNVKASLLKINGETLIPEQIRTHGQSTLNLRRKSYSFKLESKASFRFGKKDRSLSKFLILGLSMDRNYINSRLAFGMMEEINLFNLFYTFCELKINDQTEGIGLVLERPEDWAIDIKDSPLIIRRGYNHSINKIKISRITNTEDAKKYKDYYKQIYRSLKQYSGEKLYKVLSDYLDVEEYMKWLSFNYFVRNGDYTDEVWLYIDPDEKKFRVIPWDYDDIFAINPHEGATNRSEVENRFIFSVEDILDKKIATDPYLFNIYLIRFRKMLEKLSPDVIKEVFENTYSELYPYFANDEIIKMSRFDAYKETNLDKMTNKMLSLYEYLIGLRERYLKSLESRITE